MAHRKRSHKSGRRKKYAVYARKTSRKRRRRTKGFLSDGQAGMKGMLKNSFSGLIGGVAVKVIDKITNGKTVPFVGASLAASFIASKFIKSPAMSAGIAGAIGYSLGERVPMLNDGMQDTEYVNPDLLNDAPMYLDEDGNEMYLADDGNFYLAENNPEFNQVYPGYVNPGFYDRS